MENCKFVVSSPAKPCIKQPTVKSVWPPHQSTKQSNKPANKPHNNTSSPPNLKDKPSSFNLKESAHNSNKWPLPETSSLFNKAPSPPPKPLHSSTFPPPRCEPFSLHPLPRSSLSHNSKIHQRHQPNLRSHWPRPDNWSKPTPPLVKGTFVK